MIESLSRSAAAKILPSFLGVKGRQRLVIMIYHRVLSQPDFMMPGEPDVSEFDWQMQLLARYFQPIALKEACKQLREGTLPERAVCVTFDDGYADNHNLALPILKSHGIPATVFVASGFLDGGVMWNDRVTEVLRRVPEGALELDSLGLDPVTIKCNADRKKAAQRITAAIKYLDSSQRNRHAKGLAERFGVNLPSLMMTSDQLVSLHEAGIEIGAHTRHHPILGTLSINAARREISEGKHDLERILGTPITAFAYPNGRAGVDFTAAHRDALPQLGFVNAVTTEPFAVTPESNPFTLPRFTPWDKTPTRFLIRLLHAYSRVAA